MYTSLDFDVGGARMALVSMLVLVSGIYLGLFFGLRPLARKYRSRSSRLASTVGTLGDRSGDTQTPESIPEKRDEFH